MSNNRKWSSDTISKVRRMRKARRTFKAAPLFAYNILAQEYEEYSYETFISDLTIRNRKSSRKSSKNLNRYGRYYEMQKMIKLYNQTGEIKYGLIAQRLRKYLTQPYRAFIRIAGEEKEAFYPATVDIKIIRELMNHANNCVNWDDYYVKESALLKYTVY